MEGVGPGAAGGCGWACGIWERRMHESEGDIPELAQRAANGDPTAAEQLLPLVYEHLRNFARKRIASEPHGQSLEPTALVHEAFLRLSVSQDREWNGRRHFFAAAAIAMRRILVERARARRSLKRGGDLQRVDLDAADPAAPTGGRGGAADEIDWVGVEAAMEALTKHDPDLAEVVNLRYFAGLTVAEVAEALGRSPRSIDRDWNVARAWLGSRFRVQVDP